MKKLLLFCLLFTYTLTNSQTLLETINLPSGTFYTSAYGMVHNNGKYWISSSSSTAGKKIIYAVNNSGNQVDVLNFDHMTPYKIVGFLLLSSLNNIL
mgnify:CR=1 FL=1